MRHDQLLRLSFVISLVATLGSLYFSDILKLPPCLLCWYQRICMYPLVILFAVALWSNDRSWMKYSVPFVVLGTLIAGYHNLLYYGIIPDSITPCTQGVSCTSRQLELLGFLTIPLMSLIAFVSLMGLHIVLMVSHRRTNEL